LVLNFANLTAIVRTYIKFTEIFFKKNTLGEQKIFWGWPPRTSLGYDPEVDLPWLRSWAWLCWCLNDFVRFGNNTNQNILKLNILLYFAQNSVFTSFHVSPNARTSQSPHY